MEESMEVLSWGSRYVLSSYGLGVWYVSSFISMGRCVWKVCVWPSWTRFIACGGWREK